MKIQDVVPGRSRSEGAAADTAEAEEILLLATDIEIDRKFYAGGDAGIEVMDDEGVGAAPADIQAGGGGGAELAELTFGLQRRIRRHAHEGVAGSGSAEIERTAHHEG